MFPSAVSDFERGKLCPDYANVYEAEPKPGVLMYLYAACIYSLL